MKRALLFDLDGTLADTDPLHFRAWQTQLSRHNFPIDEAGYLRRVSGRLNPDIVADLLPHLSEAQGQIFVAQKEAAFRKLAVNLAALPGLTALLRRARAAGMALAVVTNAPGENARMVLAALGLRDLFSQVVLAEDLPRGKPHPDPYLEALRLLGVMAREALAFEDSPSGVRAAVAAGVETVGILSGHPAEELQDAGASLLVEDFTDEGLEALLGFNAPA